MEGDKNGEADCKKAGYRTFYDVCCDHHKLSDGTIYAGSPSDTSGRAGKLLRYVEGFSGRAGVDCTEIRS